MKDSAKDYADKCLLINQENIKVMMVKYHCLEDN